MALKILGEKSCEIKGGGQEMAAMKLMLIKFNRLLRTTPFFNLNCFCVDFKICFVLYIAPKSAIGWFWGLLIPSFFLSTDAMKTEVKIVLFYLTYGNIIVSAHHFKKEF